MTESEKAFVTFDEWLDKHRSDPEVLKHPMREAWDAATAAGKLANLNDLLARARKAVG